MACAVEPLLGEVFLVPHEIDVRRTRDYGESVVCFIGIQEILFTDMRLFFVLQMVPSGAMRKGQKYEVQSG